MDLKNIYQPIEKELKGIEQILQTSLGRSTNPSIVEMGNFLLTSPGKRIRPALVILCAKATLSKEQRAKSKELVKIASAIELIHIASLIHDDVIDRATLRHNRPTVNSRWGSEVSIALGDYLYSVAFELVSDCGNPDIIQCISQGTKQMCEGELLQVCERDNLDLQKERYILIIKKKTASLFASSCKAGAQILEPPAILLSALEGYGLNFGIAFQIIDDYLDLVGEKQKLGKVPGQDLGVGEITLPIINLYECVSANERDQIKRLLASSRDRNSLERIKSKVFSSGAIFKTKETISAYIKKAKEKLSILPDSHYKESLFNLAEFMVKRGFNDKS